MDALNVLVSFPLCFVVALARVQSLTGVHHYSSHFLFLPDLESARKGYISLIECQDYSMRRDTMKHLQAIFSQFLHYYPLNGEARHFNTGTMVNILSSILRKLLPEHLHQNYQVGFRFDGHMGTTMLTPTVKEANARTLVRMQEALKRRYDNEKTFRLVLDDDG